MSPGNVVQYFLRDTPTAALETFLALFPIVNPFGAVPMFFALLVGKYLFKMHPGILLGACAGARASTVALSVIQDAANSRVPALGFTVCFAVSNTLLTICGVVIVLLLR